MAECCQNYQIKTEMVRGVLIAWGGGDKYRVLVEKFKGKKAKI
jgi:hypothetical protein